MHDTLWYINNALLGFLLSAASLLVFSLAIWLIVRIMKFIDKKT